MGLNETATENKNAAQEPLTKWIALHIAGSVIAVFGLLYLIGGMQLIPGTPGSNFQAILMVAGGLILDFWGVVGLTRILRARKATKAAQAKP